MPLLSENKALPIKVEPLGPPACPCKSGPSVLKCEVIKLQFQLDKSCVLNLTPSPVSHSNQRSGAR